MSSPLLARAITDMRQIRSPNYEHDKLGNPPFDDLVDVFEDCWRHYIFSPCTLLLNAQHGDVAALTLCSYFEAIGRSLRGQDTNGRLKEFFCMGLRTLSFGWCGRDDSTGPHL